MSFKDLSFSEKFLKIGSIVFMSLITILIVFTFGMPSFTNVSQMDDMVFATVDNKMISQIDLNEAKENMIRNFRRRGKIPEGMEEQYNKYFLFQAGEQLIKQEILNRILKSGGFTVLSEDQKFEILDDYLKMAASQYVKKDGSFDYKKFDKEINPKYPLILEDALKRYEVEKFERITNLISHESSLDALEEMRMDQTKLSYKILLINADTKKKILQKKVPITNKEIVTKFKIDYLTKDKKAKLTKIKREAIRNSIFNKKKSKYEAEWKKALREEVKKSSVNTIATKNYSKVVALNNVAISESLDSKLPKQKGKSAISFASLQNSKDFSNLMFQAKIGENQGPFFIGGNTYIVVVTKRKFSDLPSASEVIKKKLDLQKVLKEKDEKLASAFSEKEIELKRKYERLLQPLIYEVEKSKITIVRNKKFLK